MIAPSQQLQPRVGEQVVAGSASRTVGDSVNNLTYLTVQASTRIRHSHPAGTRSEPLCLTFLDICFTPSWQLLAHTHIWKLQRAMAHVLAAPLPVRCARRRTKASRGARHECLHRTAERGCTDGRGSAGRSVVDPIRVWGHMDTNHRLDRVLCSNGMECFPGSCRARRGCSLFSLLSTAGWLVVCSPVFYAHIPFPSSNSRGTLTAGLWPARSLSLRGSFCCPA